MDPRDVQHWRGASTSSSPAGHLRSAASAPQGQMTVTAPDLVAVEDFIEALLSRELARSSTPAIETIRRLVQMAHYDLFVQVIASSKTVP